MCTYKRWNRCYRSRQCYFSSIKTFQRAVHAAVLSWTPKSLPRNKGSNFRSSRCGGWSLLSQAWLQILGRIKQQHARPLKLCWKFPTHPRPLAHRWSCVPLGSSRSKLSSRDHPAHLHILLHEMGLRCPYDCFNLRKHSSNECWSCLSRQLGYDLFTLIKLLLH